MPLLSSHVSSVKNQLPDITSLEIKDGIYVIPMTLIERELMYINKKEQPLNLREQLTKDILIDSLNNTDPGKNQNTTLPLQNNTPNSPTS